MRIAHRNSLFLKLLCIVTDVIILFAFGKTAFLSCSAVFLCVYTAFEVKSLFVDLYQHRLLIWNLAINDFKTRYAGSYLGIIWAFIQPVVTILVYWFVFQVGFRQPPFEGFPYVLWLISGLIPWFFFQEALNTGTNCLIEYSYLVKKVVFNINILPVVKIISALFVHMFFTGFAMLVFALFGFFPTVYMIQIVYYLFAMSILILGLISFTSAVVIFFRDLGQLIQIILQVGIWVTPIMWNLDMIPTSMSWAVALLKLNPMYYIVNGYRSCFITYEWFWVNSDEFFMFWIITLAMLWIGIKSFKRLRIHFADVL